MQQIAMSADQLVSALLTLANTERVCILDSCGVGHLGSHLLIAGISPVESVEISNDNPSETLDLLDEKLSNPNLAAVFTISYDFGLILNGIKPREKEQAGFSEPDVFLALFDCLVIHDYDSGKTVISGDERKIDSISQLLKDSVSSSNEADTENASLRFDQSKADYLAKIEMIKERIRNGYTYQTNLTQQIIADLPTDLNAEEIFSRLRQNHPAPFAAFISRSRSTVVSASPERFIQIIDGDPRTIRTSPIKGTRRRSASPVEDIRLRNELLNSEKDRAENTMIVDLLRNDLGRICEFGSVQVEKLCDLEEHPTLFHLVSTVSGTIKPGIVYSDVLKAVFPCGSITGAPKLSTMRIIDELEPVGRGLSMGAIGYRIPGGIFSIGASFEMSVAIRTMVVHTNTATFNVGGGIVIDSDPESEYDETLLKAKALIEALRTSS